MSACKKSLGTDWIAEVPEGWTCVRLKSLFEFRKGLTITKEDLTEEGVRVINYGQIHAKYNKSTTIDERIYRRIPESYVESNPECIVKKGDFIFVDTSEDIEGLCNFILVDSDCPVLAGSHTIILEHNNNENPKYLAYQFLCNPWRNQYRKNAIGVKVYSMTQNLLKTGTVIIPPMAIQNNVVKYLDSQIEKINILIEATEELIGKLDGIIKSRFIEMFDIQHCDKWIPLSRVVTSIESGKSFNCDKKRDSEDKPAILKLGAIFGGVYNPEENKEVDSSLFIKSLEVKKGDVLMSRKNTYDLVGTAAFVSDTPPNLMIPDLIFRLNLSESINPVFFVSLINNEMFRPRIRELAHGSSSSMPNISKEALRGLRIPDVTLDAQNEFASFVQQVDKSRFELQALSEQLIVKLNDLKQSLIYELVTGRMLLPEET